MTIAGRKVWSTTGIIERTAIIDCSVSLLQQFILKGSWKIIFSLGRRCPWADEGWGKVLSPDPLPSSATPPSLRGRGLFFGWWILRLRLSTPRRMTGWCGVLRRVKVFGLAKPTERKSDAVCIVIGLMLCESVMVWCYVNWFWLIHVFDKEHRQFIFAVCSRIL